VEEARSPAVESRTPERRATYRIQLHEGFGFDEAAALPDYLCAPGESDRNLRYLIWRSRP
jgi:maltooligosyltrehalose synthase